MNARGLEQARQQRTLRLGVDLAVGSIQLDVLKNTHVGMLGHVGREVGSRLLRPDRVLVGQAQPVRGSQRGGVDGVLDAHHFRSRAPVVDGNRRHQEKAGKRDGENHRHDASVIAVKRLRMAIRATPRKAEECANPCPQRIHSPHPPMSLVKTSATRPHAG